MAKINFYFEAFPESSLLSEEKKSKNVDFDASFPPYFQPKVPVNGKIGPNTCGRQLAQLSTKDCFSFHLCFAQRHFYYTFFFLKY